jgi:hypothetical protein
MGNTSEMEIINSANSAVLMTLTDAGSLTIATNSVAGANVYSNTSSANSGTYYFGYDGTKYLQYTGTSFVFIGGGVQSASFTVNNGSADGGEFNWASAGYTSWSSDNFNGNLRFFQGGNVIFTLNNGGTSTSTSGSSWANDFRTGSAVYGGASIELGSQTAAGPTFIDFHSDGLGTDYNGRIICTGSGAMAINGQSLTSSATFYAPAINLTSSYGVENSSYSGGSPWIVTGVRMNPNWNMCHIQALHYPGVWAGINFDVSGAAFSFRNAGTAFKSAGSSVWDGFSDARIKDVKGDYASGLDAIAALRPVRFTYKGNATYVPPSHFKDGEEVDDETRAKAEKRALVAPYANSLTDADIEYIGLLAQEGELSMPELFSRSKAYIDGVEVDDFRNVNYHPLFFALINAVKELKTRVEYLEAKVGL